MNNSVAATQDYVLHATTPSAVHDGFREALAHFGSGVVVITATSAAGAPVGMTVGSFTSISLSPPLIGFFAGHRSTTLPSVLHHGSFCANILSEEQHALARTFARSGADKFAGIGWAPAHDGSPRLAGAHAWIECTIDDHHAIGDHEIVVGSVTALTVPDTNDPLIFHRSVFHGLRAHR